MQPSPRSWSRRAVPAPWAVLVVGALIGMLAEWAVGLDDAAKWIPDYLTGLGMLVAGAATMRLNRGTSSLVGLTAVMWWLGTLMPEAQYIHRIPLFEAVAVYPGWRPVSMRAAIALAAFYVAVAMPAFSGSDAGTAIYGLAVLGVAVFRYSRAQFPSSRFTRTALQASLTLFAGTTGLAVVRWAVSRPTQIAASALLAYQAFVVATGLILWWGLRRPSVESLADMVIELDETGGGSIRDQLRRLLGDPLLEVLYRTDDDSYVTAQGVPGLPVPELGRVATPVTRNGVDELVIVHDRSILQSEDLLAAVESVTRLSTANATLLAETRERLRSLSESRERLVVAEEQERLRLADELRKGVKARLETVERKLEGAIEEAATDQTRIAIGRALDQLRLTRGDLEAISEGLHPQPLTAPLDQAVRTLTAGMAIPVEVTVPSIELPAAAKTAIYYLSSEALNNITKHARAHHAELSVTVTGGRVVLTVSDDGVGGADPAGGSGLKGIHERVVALGGDLEVSSPIGGGTRLVAEFPLGDQPSLDHVERS